MSADMASPTPGGPTPLARLGKTTNPHASSFVRIDAVHLVHPRENRVPVSEFHPHRSLSPPRFRMNPDDGSASARQHRSSVASVSSSSWSSSGSYSARGDMVGRIVAAERVKKYATSMHASKRDARLDESRTMRLERIRRELAEQERARRFF